MFKAFAGKTWLGFSVGLAALLPGCTGGMGGGPGTGVGQAEAKPAHVTLMLVNEGATPGVRKVTLEVTGVEVREQNGPWLPVPLGKLATQARLMAGTSSPIVEEGEVPEGFYREVKVRLGDRHSFLAGDGASHPLTAPAELLCTHAELNVRKGTLARCALLVSAAQAVRETAKGAGTYALQGHELLFRDLSRTGFITGKVSLEATNTPVAGTIVTAQSTSPGQQNLLVLRTALTRKDGTYTLDLLPLGRDYRVVAVPGQALPFHDFAVSPNLHLGTPGALAQTQDLLVHPLPSRQGGRVKIAHCPEGDPGSHLSEWNLRRPFQAILGMTPIHVVLGQARVTGAGPFTFGPLPAGPYTVSYRQEGWLPKATMGIGNQGESTHRDVRVMAGNTATVE